MGVAPLHGLGHFVDDMLGRGLIGVTHTKINNIFAPRPRGGFQFPNDVEHIGWQTLDALKIVIHSGVAPKRTVAG